MRVLFVAEAVTLAHVARVHALAQLLDPAAYDICVATDPRYDALVGAHAYASRPIVSISTARFAAALEAGRPIYDVATLDGYVADDTAAIDAFAPDVVVGDFRLSLNVSARRAGKPYVNVINAGWSPRARGRMTVPDLPMTRWLGVPIAQRLFDLARPLSFAVHARPLNALRRRHGLAALPSDLREAYTDADAVLYADVPALFPRLPLPPHHAFLGPVLWSPAVPVPDWWTSLPDDRPVVYVTLGSSGPGGVLPRILDALADAPVTVIAATAGRSTIDRPPVNAFVGDILDGTRAAQRAGLVICNGGSPTCYQALAAGTPILGIPTNLDQFLNMAAIEEAGVGLALRTADATGARIAGLVDRLLHEPAYRLAARRLQVDVAAADPGAVLDATLRKLTDRPRAEETSPVGRPARRPAAIAEAIPL